MTDEEAKELFEKNKDSWAIVFDVLARLIVPAIDSLYNDVRYRDLQDFLKYEGKYDSYIFTYDDQTWILDNFGFFISKDHPLPNKIEEILSVMDARDNRYLKEIQKIVKEPKFTEREKLLLVLSVIEPYIRSEILRLPIENQALKTSYPSISFKTDATRLLNRDHQLDDQYYLFDFAWIVCIIFRSTYGKTELLDRRLPYRNFIFHTGILDYSEEEIHYCYTLLMTYVYILHTITLKFCKRANKEQLA